MALQSHPDVVDDYYPKKQFKEAYGQYKESYPPTEDFVIGLLVNPCGANGTEDDIALGYDCCMERYGQGEYAFRPGSRNKFSNGYSNGIPISYNEPLHNIELVDEAGNPIDYKHSRRADDILYLDEHCTGLREPHMSCINERFAATRSPHLPPCWDNNQTVDATLDSFTPAGKRIHNAMQIAYSQNAYVNVCGGESGDDDDHCGTYIEIHKENGSPYDDEATILSEVKITTPVTNGMMTTVLPLTYSADPNRILCSYEEIDIQLGSMVRVNTHADLCCCPSWLKPTRRIGAFFCPKRQWSKDGPFAPKLESLEGQYADDVYQQSFPWCPDLEAKGEDVIMCTQERPFADSVPISDPGRYFVRPCTTLVENEDDGLYSSTDLHGKYSDVCPYGNSLKVCGLTSPDESCHEKDYDYTFRDKIGKLVHVPESPVNNGKKYGVTFNNGRSVYWFARTELEFLKPEGNYQLWFVLRNRYEKIVQKKKPFKVSWPRCTYDPMEERYFPYAQLVNKGPGILHEG